MFASSSVSIRRPTIAPHSDVSPPGIPCPPADVDDLQEIGSLEQYINASRTIVVFCSAGYAQSKNCMIELRTAVASRKPLIALLETDEKHGGVTQDHMCEQLMEAESRFRGWGFESEPGSAELVVKLFEHEAIEWNRLGPMQDVTMRLLAERAAGVTDEVRGTTYMQGELVRTPFSLHEPSPSHKHHLYCSCHNHGAEALAMEVASARKLTALKVTTSAGEMPSCEAMLVYLTARTWTSGEASRAFAAEVEVAMQQGKRLLLAHEMPGLGQEMQRSTKFESFFEPGQTPPALLALGIYSEVAVTLKGGVWREASMALLARKIATEAEQGSAARTSFRGAVRGLGLLTIKWLPSGRARSRTGLAVEDGSALALDLDGSASGESALGTAVHELTLGAAMQPLGSSDQRHLDADQIHEAL